MGLLIVGGLVLVVVLLGYAVVRSNDVPEICQNCKADLSDQNHAEWCKYGIE